MEISQIMNPGVVSIQQDESAALAARLMSRHNVGALPVCSENGKLRGLITDRDIVTRCIAADSRPEDTSVRDIMSRGVYSVSPGDAPEKAARLMAKEQVRRLPVTENGRLVGMLSLSDLARSGGFDMETAEALAEISSGVRKK